MHVLNYGTQVMNARLKLKVLEQFGRQWMFAKAIGVDDSIVSKVITGAKTLPVEKQKVWAQKLKCQVSDIFPKGY